jgi:hypothetical protein
MSDIATIDLTRPKPQYWTCPQRTGRLFRSEEGVLGAFEGLRRRRARFESWALGTGPMSADNRSGPAEISRIGPVPTLLP